MGTKWALNLFLPTTLTDAEMQEIPMARTELHIHVMYKTVQAGSILGMTVFGPLIGLLRRRPIVPTCLKAGKIGALIGIPAGPLMVEQLLKATKSNDEMVWDRSYRIRYNRSQVRVDRMCTFGALGGAALAMATKASPINGLVTGIVVSTLGTAVYNNAGMVKEESVVRPADYKRPVKPTDADKAEEAKPEEAKPEEKPKA